MGKINDQGIWNYSDNDIVQSWPVFMNLGFNSVSDVIKGLQKGRVIIADNTQDYDTKIAAIRKAGAGQYEVLIFRKDTGDFLINTNGQLKKISGGEVDVDYTNNNSGFNVWKRYMQDGSGAVISQNITLPKAGVWLITPTVTIANDGPANGRNTNIDMLCAVASNNYRNVGAMNTYETNSSFPFSGNPIPYYAKTPNTSVAVSVKISCSTSANIGWGGLVIGAAKIG